MNVLISKELLSVFSEIVAMNKTVSEWREIESSDMFQTENICGGFEALEDKFTFSIYTDIAEYWLQVSLVGIEKVVGGDTVLMDIQHHRDL